MIIFHLRMYSLFFSSREKSFSLPLPCRHFPLISDEMIERHVPAIRGPFPHVVWKRTASLSSFSVHQHSHFGRPEIKERSQIKRIIVITDSCGRRWWINRECERRRNPLASWFFRWRFFFRALRDFWRCLGDKELWRKEPLPRAMLVNRFVRWKSDMLLRNYYKLTQFFTSLKVLFLSRR